MAATKQTLEQRRARDAWEVVSGVTKNSENPKKFGGQARKLPTRIIASGLGQALAFLEAKNYAPDLTNALARWVLYLREGKTPPREVKGRELLLAVINGDSDFLRRTTDEVLAYLLWLNRFAEAEKLTEND